MVLNSLQESMVYILQNNSSSDFLRALIIFFVAFGFLYFLKFLGSSRTSKFFKNLKVRKIEEKINFIRKTLGYGFFMVLPVYLFLININFGPKFTRFFDILFLVVILFYLVKVVHILISVMAQRVIIKEEKKDRDFDPSFIHFIDFFFKILIWIVAILFFVSNLGFDVTTLLAGLGIGGLAVAFALQNVLADIFASISIYIDKPFKKGDFIIIGSDLGTVDKVGIKSTRINTLQGQELIVSNRELTNTRVNNYKRMKKRRVAFQLGVVYSTSLDKCKKAVDLIKDVINNVEEVELDRVHFQKFADFSLVYEVVYYVNTNDYNKYMDVQQEINFNIKKKFEKEKIEFAFPTQTLYLNKD